MRRRQALPRTPQTKDDQRCLERESLSALVAPTRKAIKSTVIARAGAAYAFDDPPRPKQSPSYTGNSTTRERGHSNASAGGIGAKPPEPPSAGFGSRRPRTGAQRWLPHHPPATVCLAASGCQRSSPARVSASAPTHVAPRHVTCRRPAEGVPLLQWFPLLATPRWGEALRPFSKLIPLDPGQVGSGQVGPRQVGPEQVGLGQVGPEQVGPSQVGAGQGGPR